MESNEVINMMGEILDVESDKELMLKINSEFKWAFDNSSDTVGEEYSLSTTQELVNIKHRLFEALKGRYRAEYIMKFIDAVNWPLNQENENE